VAVLEHSVRELTDAHRIARLGRWTWDRATGAVFNSPELYAIYGIDTGQTVELFEKGETLYAPESWQRLRAAAGRTFETGDPFELDMEIVHPDAESVWVIVSGEVADRSPAGEISGLRGTVQEITARKHSDQQLARSEAGYRSLVRISPSLIWSTGDPSGDQMHPLPEWQAFTGQTDAEMLSTGWSDAVHPDDLAASDAAWKLAVATGTTFHRRERIRRRDGVYRTMQVSAVPSRDAAGNILEWVGMHTDITDRLAAEADAGLAHERLEGMLSGMTDGLALRDKQGRYTYMSERAAQILRVDRKAVIGKAYWEVFPTAKQSQIAEQTERAITTRQPVHFEEFLDGDVNKWLEYHYYPTDEGLSVYLRDITERKQSEQALARTEDAAHHVHETLEGVLAGMTDGLCILDRNWCFTYLNERGSRVLGVRAEGMLGLCIWDVFPTAENSAFGRACHQAVDSGKPAHVIQHQANPRDKWVENHCYPSAEGLSIYFRDVTETKLAEQALARSEAAALLANVRLEGVLDSMTDGFCMLDKDWRYTYFSESGARMLGVRAEDQVGQLMGEMYPEIEDKIFARMYRQATDTGLPVHFEEYYPEPLNKWLDTHVYPTDEGLSIYFSDITVRKHAQEAAARSEAVAHKANVKLEGVLSGMTDGLITLDKDWRFTYYSERGAQLLGVIVKDMIGNCVWDVFPEAEQSLFGRMYHQAVDTRQPVHFEEYYPEPLNIWLECHCYPTDEGLSVYFRDISERKHAEEAIARSQAEALRIHQTLEGVLGAMTDGLNIVDKDWRYTYFNEQAARLLFVRAEDMLGKTLWEMFPRAEGSTFGLKMREAVATGKTTHTLDFYPEPVNKWLDCHYYPTSEGLSIYFHDVTEKQLAGEALLRAEKLSMASSLASSIASELKNPLESATELLDQTLEMELSRMVRSSLLRARQELTTASQSAIQSLRFEPHPTIPTNADVSELMESALQLFAPRFTAAGIEVESDYISYLRLRCHAEELRQVFASLLSNALEATPSGGTVRLHVRPSKFFGGVLITVADTGMGIPLAIRARVFDLFASTKAGSSSGLGLWVSAATVRKHGGRISFRSRTGDAGTSGTVFSIFLPDDGVDSPPSVTPPAQ
jgi:PAS domain S-box-containing protein